MIVQLAVSSTRSQALAASLGVGVGGMIFVTAALLGLQGVLLAVPSIYVVLKFLGGLYLCYLGYIIFRSAKQPLRVTAGNYESKSQMKSFSLGLITQVSNPKAAIVYASVFAALLPHHYSPAFAVALLALIFLVEVGWFCLVSLLLSSVGPQKAYLSFKIWVDRAVGAVMFGLGLKLLTDASKP